MNFTYRARDATGQVKTGTLEAVSAVKAAETLHREGLVVLELEPEASGFQSANLEKYFWFLNRVPRKQLVIFSRMFSTLLNAKIPIIQIFEILVDQTDNKTLKRALTSVMEDVRAGKSVSEALVNFPQIFSSIYISLVKAGELSGTLDETLMYLADQQEKDYELMAKVRGAMVYPVFIVAAIIGVGTLMFIFVLPQMIDVLQESGVELPLTTKILIFMTNLIQNYWHVILLVGGGSIIGSQVYIRTEGGRRVWDQLKLRIPVLSKVSRNIYMDRFSRNLSTLVASNIPIVTALKTTGDIVGNTVYRDIIMRAASDVEIGKTISDVFANRSEIPIIVTQMVRVGEQTGELADLLGKLANFFDKEVENAVGALASLLEPIIMILLGIAVAAMVAGVILPIYNLASAA